MQVFQTGPHFKLEEVCSERVFFRLDITDLTRMFGAVGNSIMLGKVSFTC